MSWIATGFIGLVLLDGAQAIGDLRARDWLRLAGGVILLAGLRWLLGF